MYILCVGGKLVFGWLCGSSSPISKPNQERRNWRESFLFLVKYKKIFCASQIVRSRSRKREIIITEEKASHPSWSSAITRKYGVVQSHFGVPSLPLPFPPFPPQSSVFQTEFRCFCEMKYLLEKETHNKNEDNTLKELNSLTAIRVPAGTKNSRPVGFLR